MAQEIAVDTERMSADIEKLREILEVAKRQNETMKANVNDLNAKWTGASHDVFVKRFNKECQNTEEIFNVVNDVIQSMLSAKGQYERCENEVNSIVSAIRI